MFSTKRFLFLINWSKKIILPGFRGMNLFQVAIFFIEGIEKGSLTTRASSIAFNFFLAFFPALIFFFTLIPYIPITNFQEILMGLISDVLPPSTNESFFLTLNDIINHPRGGLLSFGFLMALYFSSNSINALMEAFNSSFHITETRSVWKQRLISFNLTISLSFILILAISMIVFTQIARAYLIEWGFIDPSSLTIIVISKWIILLSCLFIGISLLFQFGPSQKTDWKLFSPGAILATI